MSAGAEGLEVPWLVEEAHSVGLHKVSGALIDAPLSSCDTKIRWSDTGDLSGVLPRLAVLDAAVNNTACGLVERGLRERSSGSEKSVILADREIKTPWVLAVLPVLISMSRKVCRSSILGAGFCGWDIAAGT